MPHSDAYGRVFVTRAELDKQAEDFRDRLETVPIIRPVWNPQTLTMETRPTTQTVLKRPTPPQP